MSIQYATPATRPASSNTGSASVTNYGTTGLNTPLALSAR
jgi:hypothetical protein